MTQLFDPLKFTTQQLQSLQNIPGQSWAESNSAALIQSIQDNPNVITPSNLTATGQYGIVDPVKSIIPDVSTLENTTPELTLTPQEQQYSDLSKKVQQENTDLAGKDAYQAEQNTLAGVDTQQQALDDLGHQLTALQNEAKAIPLQLQNNSAGITTGVMQTMTDAALRTNAIKALTVSTLIDATNGYLDSAQKKADQAVALKYGVLEAQNKADIANLELIKNDPATSLQDKNRADAQLAKKEANDAKIAQDKQNYADTQKIAVDAASNGNNFTPTSDYKTVTQALTAIQNAKSPVEATTIAVQTGLVQTQKSASGSQVVGSAATGYYMVDDQGNVKKLIAGADGGSGGGVNPQPIPNLFTKAQIADMQGGGLSSDIATQIYQSIQNGHTLEDIRQALREDNMDPALLDVFDRVNNIRKVLGQPAPTKTTTKTKTTVPISTP
jgi:hypothetical protein